MGEVPLQSNIFTALLSSRSAAQLSSFSTSRCYRGTSLIRNSVPLGPYSSNMPRALWRP